MSYNLLVAQIQPTAEKLVRGLIDSGLRLGQSLM